MQVLYSAKGSRYILQQLGITCEQCKIKYFLSPNTNVNTRENVCKELNILTKPLSDTYVGLSTMVGVGRSDCFQHLFDRVCQRLKGWKEKTLSMQGKRLWQNLQPKQFILMPCMFLNFPKEFASLLPMKSLGSGGVITRRKRRCTGLHDGGCAFQRRKGAWVQRLAQF